MRHGVGGGVVLMPARSAAPPRRGLWRGKLGFAAATAALGAAATLLLTGVYVRPPGDQGSCPRRTSVAAHAAGLELLVRAEPARPGGTLLHLCVDRPVREWSVRLDGAEPVAVQPVAGGQAIAAATLIAGRRTPVLVRVVPASGAPITFVTQLVAP
ncbi:hypothetical protein GCM10010172_59150 [Paractinoplanes ferrugineus]|uniref:Uncharacterized protein n=1 Tax=Paractinoplanes ferrugineus TaxID=113564 RepID=A0A919J5H2_9ACTN|nr:hypothetical protein Afe05nite_62180 [Actinoplanes ferrugineus]